MFLDVLASVRSTALIALVAASFSSPIVVKSDAFASASAAISGSSVQKKVATEALVAGGVEFAMPQAWGRLGATAAAGNASQDRVGTVVSGLCPGGSEGATCDDGVQVTFIAYTGEKGHELPTLTAFGTELDSRLAREFPGYRKTGSKVHDGHGTTWLDYGFTWRSGRADLHQRFAAYRHKDGSGVVVTVAGAQHAGHAKAIDRFLDSGKAVAGGH